MADPRSSQYIADEPDGDGTGLDPLWLADTVAKIRARDPYHPITLVLNCVENPYRTVDDYAVYADIVLSDPYPIGLRNQVRHARRSQAVRPAPCAKFPVVVRKPLLIPLTRSAVTCATAP